jgi:putative PIN family toxin of toxin-antitoxin system
VVVSALTAGGTPQKIIQAWIAGQFLAIVSKELRHEINLVLERAKFIPFDRKRRILLGVLFNQSLTVLPKRIHKQVFTDENDHFLYELAVTGESSVIVTGDKGLLKVKKVSGIVILNPDQFCKRFNIRNPRHKPRLC